VRKMKRILIVIPFFIIMIAPIISLGNEATATTTSVEISVDINQVIKSLENEIEMTRKMLEICQKGDIEKYTQLLKRLTIFQQKLEELRERRAEIEALKEEVRLREEMLKERHFKFAVGVTTSMGTYTYLPIAELDLKIYKWTFGAVFLGVDAVLDPTWNIERVGGKIKAVFDLYTILFPVGVEATYFSQENSLKYGIFLGMGVERGIISVNVEYDFGTQLAEAKIGVKF